MLIKEIEKHEGYSLMLLFCFVRIQWWLCRNPQRVYLFPQQSSRAGTVFEQGEARKDKSGKFIGIHQVVQCLGMTWSFMLMPTL